MVRRSSGGRRAGRADRRFWDAGRFRRRRAADAKGGDRVYKPVIPADVVYANSSPKKPRRCKDALAKASDKKMAAKAQFDRVASSPFTPRMKWPAAGRKPRRWPACGIRL